MEFEIYDCLYPQVKETEIIFKNKSVGCYLYGSCHLFAIAYAELNNQEITALFSEIESDKTDSGYISALDHAYCIEDSVLIDARGQSGIEEVESDYSVDSMNSFRQVNALKTIKEWVKVGLLADFESGEKEALISFIEKCKKSSIYNPLTEKEAEKIEDFLEQKKEAIKKENKANSLRC